MKDVDEEIIESINKKMIEGLKILNMKNFKN